MAIVAVVLGGMDVRDGRNSMPEFRQPKAAVREVRLAKVDGLKWATPKADRLQTSSGAISTKYVVQESVNQKRGNREYIHNKFYARVAVRLAAVPLGSQTAIPPFNPVKLYGGSAGEADGEHESRSTEPGEVAVRVVELLGSILPTEDGQEIDNQEVVEIVGRAGGGRAEEGQIRPTFVPEGALAYPAQKAAQNRNKQVPEPLAPNTSVVEKSVVERDDIADEPDGRQIKVKVGRGETLPAILQRMGADAWLAREMADRAKTALADAGGLAGHDIELTLVPSLADPSKSEPTRMAIFSAAGEHKVTVRRNAAGELVASTTPVEAAPARTDGKDMDASGGASLYASLYQAALLQGLPEELILHILRIHAYETDFRRRARGSDAIDLFFDLKDEGKAADNPLADLLSTAITVGGDSQRYFRFRTPDGVVDYYDESGNNSRKFLMRKPIRNEEVRFVSGFGLRRHPLLQQVKMHTGVDWAGPQGTPILAAGNGIIEEAGFKGQNGNYIRIRHANGYQTAYSHMQGRFPPGIVEEAKVRQGQVIGYLGNTGLSTGPHLHFEILVGNRFVDPMSIQVPKERKLTGKMLQDFQRERARIEDLMGRPPVRVAQIDAKDGR